MTDNLIGYARVSTADQNLDMQRAALLAAGVAPSNIYVDRLSGAVAAARRPGLTAALDACRPGSCLVFWRLDRLGRSIADLVSTVDALADRDVHIRSLTDGVDTTGPTGRLLLGIFATLAEYERLLIRERVQQGVDAARARGVRFGRPAPDPAEVAAKVRMARRAMDDDGLSAADAARLVGWSRSTLYRHMQAAAV